MLVTRNEELPALVHCIYVLMWKEALDNLRNAESSCFGCPLSLVVFFNPVGNGISSMPFYIIVVILEYNGRESCPYPNLGRCRLGE